MMVDVPSQPPLSPLVGRDEEIHRVSDLLGIDGDPGGHVVLGGDAGVGKSRVLAEVGRLAEAAGWRVLIGHCLDFGDGSMPYLPFSEAFGRLAGESADIATSLGRDSPAIARLLPRHRLLADSAPDSEAAPDSEVAHHPGTAHPEGAAHLEVTDRSALFDAVHEGLTRLGHDAPLLLVVEDVHWADQSTRELLTFCFSRPFDTPVGILTSYRSDDLHRRHPLRATLAEWTRRPSVSRLQLAPLSTADLRVLVRALRPESLSERDLLAILGRADGNPFYAEELVAAAESTGGALPAELADVLLARLDRLDDDGRLVVRAASATGRRVSHELLARGAGIDGVTLDRGVRASVEANVLVAVGTDGYAFRHALLAEAVYADLLPASGSGYTRPTHAPWPVGRWPAPPPNWPATRGSPTTCRAPPGQASRPATRRWRSAALGKLSGTTRWRWSCWPMRPSRRRSTPGAPTGSTRPIWLCGPAPPPSPPVCPTVPTRSRVTSSRGSRPKPIR